MGMGEEKPLVYYQLRHLPTLESMTAMSGCNYSLKVYKNEQLEFRCISFLSHGSGVATSALLEALHYAYDESKYQVTLQVLSPLNVYVPWISKSQLTNKHAVDGYRSSLKAIKKHIVSRCNKHFGSSKGDRRLSEKSRSAEKKSMERLPSLVWVPAADILPIIDGSVHVKMFLSRRSSDQVSTPIRRRNAPEMSESRQTPLTPASWQEMPVEETPRDVFSHSVSEPTKRIVEHSAYKLSASEKQEIKDRIQAWSHTQTGKLKDIRSLLSTIEEVLWSDASWKAMPMSALVGDKDAIKKYYR